MTRKYDVDKISIKNLLNDVEQGRIMMPEIQRPFVWNTTKVRDLIDSISRGFPVGYIITSEDPEMIGKDGKRAEGKTSIIDGQQRITALRASILGEEVVNRFYKKVRIKIAYNPFPDEEGGEERFATWTPAIEKSPRWISDISEVLTGSFTEIKAIIDEFAEKNPFYEYGEVERGITALQGLLDQQIGFIKLLSKELTIDEVAEIFERINSAGVPLNQADFTMSKLASEPKVGSEVRKIIDYFAHLVNDGDFYRHIEANDVEFRNSDLLGKIGWVRNLESCIYEPDYSDIIRTSFTYKFGRGKLADLVALLSGRNFETRVFEERIAEETICLLKEAVLEFVNQSNFTDFIQIVESTGFIDSKMIRSKNALNYAYVIYLILKKEKANPSEIKKLVSRWFVMSILTSRYSSSPESTIDRDVKAIARTSVREYLQGIEESSLSQQFWEVSLVNEFDKASRQHPYLNTFFAAQVYFGDNGFLSDISLRSIRTIKGDIHHIFPYDYLKRNGRGDRYSYNQIANFVYMEKSTNIQIGNKEPKTYMSIVDEQVTQGHLAEKNPIGKILNGDRLEDNLKQNCIPTEIREGSVDNYDNFLDKRRRLMVKKIESYYKSL